MFCPSCGLEDPNQNQFCRSCGTALHAVRAAVDHPDAITASAVNAREEIGGAIVAKISEFEHAHELRRAVHEILPAIERFLESPEERRLNAREQRLKKIGEGVLTSIVGVGIALSFLLISLIAREEKILIVSALGLLVLLGGLGVTAAAVWFTVLPKSVPNSPQRTPRQILPHEKAGQVQARELPAAQSTFESVTEGTTRQL